MYQAPYSVYLAGPIYRMTYQGATYWREWVQENIDYRINAFSPMRHKEHLTGRDELPDSIANNVMSNDKGITTRDRFDIMRCDCVLAHLEGTKTASIGTVMEIAWADMLRKPIVAIMTEDNVHWHSMIRDCVGFIVPSLEEAIEVVEHILLP